MGTAAASIYTLLPAKYILLLGNHGGQVRETGFLGENRQVTTLHEDSVQD